MSGIDALAADRLIDIVRAAARQEILPRFRALSPDAISTKSSPHDLVTEADLGAERFMTEAIRSAFPDALVVGEEAVAADATLLDRLETASRAVIVDPIDGTWNFAHGLATFGVILAVVEGGETVFGLLYDPIGDDWVMAHRNGGAWFCRPEAQPVRCRASVPAPIDKTTGLIPLYLFDKPTQRRLTTAMPDFARIWSLRCSCHEYRQLAQGAVHFSLSATLNVWDHAAGVLVHGEAGGYAALIDGAPYSPRRRAGSVLVAPDRASWDAIRDRLGFAAVPS